MSVPLEGRARCAGSRPGRRRRAQARGDPRGAQAAQADDPGDRLGDRAQADGRAQVDATKRKGSCGRNCAIRREPSPYRCKQAILSRWLRSTFLASARKSASISSVSCGNSLTAEEVQLTPAQARELDRRIATFADDAKTAIPWERIDARADKADSDECRAFSLRRAARADLAEAVEWYDAHAAHVVPLFRESHRAAVARIGATPRSNFPPDRIKPAGPCFHAFPTC